MATLKDIASDTTKNLKQSELKADKTLVREIQLRLRNLGLYPGGQWIDGLLGNSGSQTWQGLEQFCKINGLTTPSSTQALDATLAQKLLDTRQLPKILDQAKNTSQTLSKLTDIQTNTPAVVNIGVDDAFVARMTTNSPFVSEIENYPQNLAQKPDGTSVISYGNNITLVDSGKTVTFNNYPDRGKLPTIDSTGLNFLSSNISHACVCVGSFGDGSSPIKTHWLGKNALDPEQFLSATKFVGVLNAIAQINANFPTVDIDNCNIEAPKFRFHELVIDMVSGREDARGKLGRSNQIAVLFKRFTERPDLENWFREQTGNKSLQYRGGFGVDPLIANPIVKDIASGKIVLQSTAIGATGDNLVSAYDLVRLISMLGWHLHLSPSTRLLAVQWNSLESIVRAMGRDAARYV